MRPKKPTPKYGRILLKLSGEALGAGGLGIDPSVLDRTALEIGQLVGIGVEVGMVIGGGNLFRGATLNAAGLDRVTGDHMGMLATVMNALAMRDALERANIQTNVMSAIPMSGCALRQKNGDTSFRGRKRCYFFRWNRKSFFYDGLLCLC